MTYVWIAIGSAVGGMARYWCSRAVAIAAGETFPWGTLTVNVLGSFVIGFLAALAGPDSRVVLRPDSRNLLMVGVCGGFTTFSSFSLQTLELLRNRDVAEAFGNIFLSVSACMAAVALGYIAGMMLFGRSPAR